MVRVLLIVVRSVGYGDAIFRGVKEAGVVPALKKRVDQGGEPPGK